MKPQKQGKNECLPTAVCAVLDVDWASVKPVVEYEMNRRVGANDGLLIGVLNGYPEPSAVRWGDTTGTSRKEFISILESYLGVAINRIDTFTFPRGRCPKMAVPKTGSGVMCIVRIYCGFRMAHAVAYKDGMVMDPERGDMMSEKDFNHDYRGWRFAGFLYRVDA